MLLVRTITPSGNVAMLLRAATALRAATSLTRAATPLTKTNELKAAGESPGCMSAETNSMDAPD